MNTKTLSKIYKIHLFSSICLFFSCTTTPCSEEDIKAIKAAEKGDIVAVKKYLENGGDPLLECWTTEGRGGTSYSLSHAVTISESYELNDYYLSNYKISQEYKNSMLFTNLVTERDDLIRLLLKKGATASSYARLCDRGEEINKHFKKLHEFNYDFN